MYVSFVALLGLWWVFILKGSGLWNAWSKGEGSGRGVDRVGWELGEGQGGRREELMT